MLCLQCGNEIDDRVESCPVCEANAERGSLANEIAEPACERCGEPADACACPRELELVFCPNCGNQVEAGDECPVCTEARTRKVRARHDAEHHLCLSCGNEVYGKDPCPVCSSGRGRRKREADNAVKMCLDCGNTIPADGDCPVCGNQPRRKPTDGPSCHGCNRPLAHQDWDGARVLMCEGCNGCFFVADALEVTLDKLRDDTNDVDLRAVLAEFQDRGSVSLPKNVRYKPCPICGSSMSRRNYKGVSGVIVDCCTHGIWIEQAAFGELSEWVSRGGDKLAQMKTRRRR